MEYKLHSHRHAEAVMRSVPSSARKLDEVLQVIRGVSDSDLRFQEEAITTHFGIACRSLKLSYFKRV